jgi:hypothetical protein
MNCAVVTIEATKEKTDTGGSACFQNSADNYWMPLT